MNESVRNSVALGVALALAQSLLTTLALKWALKKTFFYWIFIGGIFARVAVLILTALAVAGNTQLNLMATLLSLVLATTVFLILESRTLLATD